jgi:hypothetical protein
LPVERQQALTVPKSASALAGAKESAFETTLCDPTSLTEAGRRYVKRLSSKMMPDLNACLGSIASLQVLPLGMPA